MMAASPAGSQLTSMQSLLCGRHRCAVATQSGHWMYAIPTSPHIHIYAQTQLGALITRIPENGVVGPMLLFGRATPPHIPSSRALSRGCSTPEKCAIFGYTTTATRHFADYVGEDML